MRSKVYGAITIVVAAGLAATVLVSCASTEKSPSASVVAAVQPPAMSDTKPANYDGLHNVVAYHESYYSGSVPEGEEGFKTLAGMGIKTIITVDGAAPDLVSAKKYGMRYIHLPIGYNGFDESRKLELVRATRDSMADGPVYIHCHHGKHRSAGAAASVAQSLGWMNAKEGEARMKVSGTAANYIGLYQCAASSTVLGANVIDAVPADFPEVQPPKGMVKSMIEIEEVNDRLKLIEHAGWKVPADHPDLVPVAEAGRLADLFRDLKSLDSSARHPQDFMEMLKKDQDRAQKIEVMLAAGEKDAAKISAEFAALGKSCKDCHAKYRD